MIFLNGRLPNKKDIVSHEGISKLFPTNLLNTYLRILLKIASNERSKIPQKSGRLQSSWTLGTALLSLDVLFMQSIVDSLTYLYKIAGASFVSQCPLLCELWSAGRMLCPIKYKICQLKALLIYVFIEINQFLRDKTQQKSNKEHNEHLKSVMLRFCEKRQKDTCKRVINNEKEHTTVNLYAVNVVEINNNLKK